jgi:hypothetical protein
MIEPISPKQREYHESYINYGVTKFIGKHGDGFRGVIVQNNGEEALLYVLNGPKVGKIIKVVEDNPDHWPIEV